jgi:hypothetical protein
MAKLTAEERKRIPKKLFGIPEKAPGSGSYPLEDEEHAKDALARSSGKPVAKRIRAKVHRLYPGMKLNPARLHSLSSMAA